MADRIDVILGAQTGDLRDGMNDAVSAVQDGADKMTATLGGLQGAFLNWEAVKEGFRVVKDAISDVIETMTRGAEEIDRLQFNLGITNEAANNLAAGLKIAGVGTDEYISTATRLERQLKTNESAFNQLGVVTRDANGNFLNGQQLIESALGALNQYKEGTDRNQASLTIFGRSIQQVYDLHLLNNQVMTEGADVLEKYGLATDAQGIAKAREFQQGINEVNLVIDKLIEKLGEDTVEKLGGVGTAIDNLVPALEKLIPLLADIIAGFAKFIGWLADAKTGLDEFTDSVVKSYFESQLQQKLTQASSDVKQFSDDVASTKAKIAAGGGFFDNLFGTDEKAELVEYTDKLNAAEIAFENLTRIAQAWATVKGQPVAPPVPTVNPPHDTSPSADTDGTKTFTAPQTGAEQLAAWRNELQQQLEASNNYFADTKDAELAFWESKLALTKAKSQEWFDIQNTIFNLNKQIALQNAQETLAQDQLAVQEAEKGSQERVNAAQKEADDVAATWGKQGPQYRAAAAVVEAAAKEHQARMVQIDEDSIAATQKAADSKLEIELGHIKSKQALGLIEGSTEIAQEQAIEDQIYQNDLTALQQELAINGLTYDQKRTLYQQIEDLTLQHNQKMAALADQAAQAQASEVKAWLDPITSSLQQSANGILQGTQTAMQAVGNLLDGLLAKFIQFGLTRLANWIATEVGMSAATTAESTVRATAETAGALTSHAAQAALNAATVTADAALAFAGVFANQAPLLGPLAAGPAAAAEALVLAQLPIASAAGGMVVPSDQIMKVHENEVVLPADISAKFLDAAPGSGAGFIYAPVIHAVDGQSVKRMLEIHGREFAKSTARHFTQNPGLRPRN